MHILIDLERLCVLYKHLDADAILNLANIEVPRAAVRVQHASEPASYEFFTDFELKMLYNHTAGQKYEGYNRQNLVSAVINEVLLLSTTTVDRATASAQVDYLERTVSRHDQQNGQYRYAPGCAEPAAQSDVFNVLALVTKPGHQPDPKTRYFARSAQPDVVTSLVAPKGNPLLPAEHVPQPRDGSAPRTSSDTPSAPPKAGSKTGRVWELAEQCFAVHAVIDKVLRGLVAAACEKEGINSSTMSVQFSKWKHSKA